MYFDLHTHRKALSAAAIVNCGMEDDLSLFPRFSMGIHPWEVDAGWEQRSVAYECLFSHPPFASFHARLCAVGEIGLDKLSGGDFMLQKACFKRQLALAGQYRLPVIIHCVKALDEVVACLSEMRFGEAVVFHGFRGKPEQAAFLLSRGFYLSFGPRFNAESLRMACQARRMFLETDDSGVDIGEVYASAAKVLSISPTDIEVPGIFTS